MKKVLGLIIVLSMIMALMAPCMAAEEKAEPLADGIYLAKFDTDSGMFHANEACEGQGFLVVKEGTMTLHVALVSKSIVNLFLGVTDDAKEADDADILEPSKDEIIYKDGYKEKVYGFNVPVPVLDEEFDLALIGKKNKWYDHKVSVSDPQPVEIEGFDLEADEVEISYKFEEGGQITFKMPLKSEE